MNKRMLFTLLGALALLALFMANLLIGSVDIPFQEAMATLRGDESVRESWRFIILRSRLPQAVAALLAGSSLAASGLMLQTAFANPLAGPDVFGINSGAGLAVALVMLPLGGGILGAANLPLGGHVAILAAAFIGAMAVTALILFLSTLVRNAVMLLIVGLMVGYMASSVVSLLNFMASAQGVKSYMIWGMGSFANVPFEQMPLFALLTVAGILLSLTRVKSLNALLLGEVYALNLGVRTRRLRLQLLSLAGLLTAVTTAYCGPIAFIGLATPHIARMLWRTDNHATLLPTSMLMGAVIALLCNLACSLPPEGGILPLNVVTPLVGAPVILHVILRHRR